MKSLKKKVKKNVTWKKVKGKKKIRIKSKLKVIKK